MIHITPLYLYKYKSLNRTIDISRFIDIIRTGKIYIPGLEELNDPMEGRVVVPEVHFAGCSIMYALEKNPPKLFNCFDRCGILSLSEIPSSPQMWAYYADNYRGACLQFSQPPFPVEPVRYASRTYGFRGEELFSSNVPEVIHAQLLTKHKDWSHECEWRAIFTEGEGHTCVPLGEDNPTAVIIGHKCDEKDADRIMEVCKERSVPLYQTYIADAELCVRIVPYGFDPSLDGKPLLHQVMDECEKRNIPLPYDW